MDGSLKARLLQAVDLALRGDWQAAHLIAQDHEGERLANWIQAVVHRMEGDIGNAQYWYGRCDRGSIKPQPTEAELRQIRDELNEG